MSNKDTSSIPFTPLENKLSRHHWCIQIFILSDEQSNMQQRTYLNTFSGHTISTMMVLTFDQDVLWPSQKQQQTIHSVVIKQFNHKGHIYGYLQALSLENSHLSYISLSYVPHGIEAHKQVCSHESECYYVSMVVRVLLCSW